MGPGNGLKGRKSNKPAVQNQAVQHSYRNGRIPHDRELVPSTP